MAGNEKKTEPSVVHQNAIHVETIRKEQRQQKLHTEFSINPHRKRELLTLTLPPLCAAQLGDCGAQQQGLYLPQNTNTDTGRLVSSFSFCSWCGKNLKK